jgi:hypothetical protein
LDCQAPFADDSLPNCLTGENFMASQMSTQMQQCLPTAGLSGTWKLAGGRAITLEPREPGTLRVAQGQLWATFDGPHRGPLNDLGDHVMGAGERLRVRPGQRLVIEAWGTQAPAYFSWDPLPSAASRQSPSVTRVIQPLADLRLALVFGADAAGRLLAGLAGLAWDLVARGERETFADCAFKAQSRACRAHGAMS